VDQKPFSRRVRHLVEELALDALGTALAIGIIAGADSLVRWLLGEGAKFFDFIPVRWVFDAGHLAMVVRLVWRVVRRFDDDG
jgi:hypothetical protein